MQSNKRRNTLIVTTILMFSFIFATISYAGLDTYLDYGWPSSTIPITEPSFNQTWQGPVEDGINNWNNTSTKIYFKYQSCDNKIKAASYADSWYGVNSSTYSGFDLTKFTIKLNSRTIGADATNFDNFVQSVLVHELGHSIWLADNPPGTYTSIMRYSRDRNTMTDPSPTDESNVDYMYP